MEKRLSRFDPKANEEIVLFGERYTVQPHPSISHLPFSSEGRRALVCQLRNHAGQYYALKVFKKKYRDKTLASSANQLKQIENIEGLRAAKRRVIMPGDPVVRSYSNLEYAMLMPWISGATWYDILQRAAKDGFHLHRSDAIHLCHRFLTVMEGLEKAGMAHTDISAGNVAVDLKALDVQLIDLEDLFITGAAAPTHQNAGSKGYRHHTCEIGKTCWCLEGDRYAVAVLAAEMLLLADATLARKATEDGFFIDHCRNEEGDKRFKESKVWLTTVAPRFTQLFESSWYAATLIECSEIEKLRAAIGEVASQTTRLIPTRAGKTPERPFLEWKPLPATSMRRKGKQVGKSPVEWVNETGIKKQPEVKLVQPSKVSPPFGIAIGTAIFIIITTILTLIIGFIIYFFNL